MKKQLLFIAISGVMAFASCTATNQTRNADDDVYYSSKDAPAPATSNNGGYSSQENQNPSSGDYYNGDNNSQPDYSSTEKSSNGDTYITNNYYKTMTITTMRIHRASAGFILPTLPAIMIPSIPIHTGTITILFHGV